MAKAKWVEELDKTKKRAERHKDLAENRIEKTEQVIAGENTVLAELLSAAVPDWAAWVKARPWLEKEHHYDWMELNNKGRVADEINKNNQLRVAVPTLYEKDIKQLDAIGFQSQDQTNGRPVFVLDFNDTEKYEKLVKFLIERGIAKKAEETEKSIRHAVKNFSKQTAWYDETAKKLFADMSTSTARIKGETTLRNAMTTSLVSENKGAARQ